MITQKDILADLHTHTIASLHAYSTVYENVMGAKQNGMKYIAITDHYMHSGDDISIRNEKYRVRFMESNVNPYSEVKVISSAEFNILQDYEYRDRFSFLKWRPIGFHKSYIKDSNKLTFDDLYEGFVEATNWNNAFNHIERDLDDLCYGPLPEELPQEAKKFLEKVVLLAKDKDIYLELNEHSLVPTRKYSKIIPYWMSIAAENGNKFYIGTDSHYCIEIGMLGKCVDMLNKYGVSKDKVLNCNEDEIRQFIRE